MLKTRMVRRKKELHFYQDVKEEITMPGNKKVYQMNTAELLKEISKTRKKQVKRQVSLAKKL